MAVIGGFLWTRGFFRKDVSHPPESESLLTATDDSTESLSYALNKFRDPSGPTTKPVISPSPLPVTGLTEMQISLNSLRMQAHNPQAFSKIFVTEIQKLDVDRLADRTILLQEMFTALNATAPGSIGPLLANEQAWLSLNLKRIKNVKALDQYIQKVVLITARSNKNPQLRLLALKKLAQIFKKDAYALKSFRTGLVGSTEWDIQNIFENIPNDLKNYVQGRRK